MNKLTVTTKVLDTSVHQLSRGFGGKDSHKGLDLVPASKSETPAVLAYDDGTVIATANVEGIYKTNKTKGMGTYVAIKHKDGSITRYQHLQYNSLKVKAGDVVKKGKTIALYGRPTNGNSTGPHLHFDISFPTKPTTAFIKSTFMGQCRYYVDPLPFLTQKTETKKAATYKVTAQSLRIRKGPGMNYSVVGYLRTGMIVTVYSVKNGFGSIKSDGSQWCSLDYLEKN